MAKKKKKPAVTINVNYPSDGALSPPQIEDLKERLKCATVLAYPERIRSGEVYVQTTKIKK